MNAGAMGVETFDQVVAVRFIDAQGEVAEKTLSEIEHHYRNVPEFRDHFVTSVIFRGAADADPEEIQALMKQSRGKRKTSQPVAASAGCTFQNPAPEIPAGELIDQLGLKGYSVGRASISDIHGNFITNDGKALASDVLTIIEYVKACALSQRGLHLETEVQILGEEEIVF